MPGGGPAPNDATWKIVGVDREGTIFEVEMTEAVLRLLQEAADAGIFGIGIGGVVASTLYARARELTTDPILEGRRRR
jgi:hypothetical protein